MKDMTSLLRSKLSDYVNSFNDQDEVPFSNLIQNDDAFDYLISQIPLIDCPDSEIEEIYYFRWWVLRKHWKSTEKGHVLTEFLTQVPWSGAYNTINCPACFHIREARWLNDSKGWLKEYIDFWLNGDGDADSYSAWYAHAVWEYCTLRNDFEYGIEKLPALVDYFERREKTHLHQSGLYWSIDDRDGMEYSISGSGLRPTVNSYAYGDAMAISFLAKLAGDDKLSQHYKNKANKLKERMDILLWDKDFYKTIPMNGANGESFSQRPKVDKQNDVKELVGFIPWYFNLPNEGREAAFDYLMRTDAFFAPAGLTTAEQCHPRFMENHDHECLWNGPVWPYATSQTLVAVANLLRNYNQSIILKEDYYKLLLQYAKSQHLTNDDGRMIPWIDENIDPFTGRWLSRDILQSWGWQKHLGGYERGKDYNHSLFCDLVLSGLLGIETNESGKLEVLPIIPDWWEYFWVENVRLRDKSYRIVYDKNGDHYGIGKGIVILEIEKQLYENSTLTDAVFIFMVEMTVI